MARFGASFLLLVLAVGCGGEPTLTPVDERPPAAATAFLPRLSDALLPGPLAGLVPGRSTAKDLLALFPDLQTAEDKSLGGSGTVAYNGHPAVLLKLPAKATEGPRAREDGVEALTFYLVPDDTGVPRLWSMSLLQDPRGGRNLCAWLHEMLGSDPEALRGSGSNRSFGHVGKSADAGLYCIGTPDGKAGILVECRSTSKGFSEVEYDLLSRPAAR